MAGLLQLVIAIPDLEVTGDEASQLRLATAFNFPAELAALLGAERALADLGPAIQV